MKKILSVLIVAAVVVLSGCATPGIKDNTLAITETQAATCAQEAPGRMARAQAGDHYEQYNVGKNLFNGCTQGRVKNPTEAMIWLEKSAEQDDLAANAFIGDRVYATYALDKHKAKKDSTADEMQANTYTDKALAIWEKAGRQGFNRVELGLLQNAVNTRGLMQQFIHQDNVAAAKFYCLSIQVSDNVGGVNGALKNLAGVGKTKADCK